MTSLRATVFAGIAAAIVLGIVLELIRRRRLGERYAFLWLLAGATMLVLAVWQDGLSLLAGAVGIKYPPTALFLVASLFILLVLLDYSTVITKLAGENRIMAQQLALLRHELERKADAPPRIASVPAGEEEVQEPRRATA